MEVRAPSGFVAENLKEARKQNPKVVRIEEKDDMIHFYMNEVRHLILLPNLKAPFVTYICPAHLNETLKWLPSLPILMRKSFSGGDSVVVRYKLPRSPFSPPSVGTTSVNPTLN